MTSTEGMRLTDNIEVEVSNASLAEIRMSAEVDDSVGIDGTTADDAGYRERHLKVKMGEVTYQSWR